ncbi:MAG: magnesium/cobalt transporter CorA [Bythopirellula sp.]|nr:magnesium/cobalt transporter CorA [Bythopirellula sp.]
MSDSSPDLSTSMFIKSYGHTLSPGARPGSINIPPGALPPTIRITCYGPSKLEDHPNCSLELASELRGKHPVMWVDIVGMGDPDLFEKVGQLFGIHRLALEDVVAIPQRSKVENYHDHLFVVAQAPRRGKKHTFEQVSFFLGNDFIISWRECPSDCFETIRHRMQFTGRAMRELGPDYLLYSLLDAMIDSYFPTLEKIGELVDRLDGELERGPSRPMIARLHGIRHDVRLLRRIVWPLREAVDELASRHEWLIGKETTVYLRDCHDHTIQILDTLDNHRDACSDLRDFFSSEINNRMNEVMKVLTIISTIFIPLSFVAGVYGMNFDTEISPWNMPELEWRYGYPAIMIIMFLIAISQLVFYRWKGWLGSFTSRSHVKNGHRQHPPTNGH